VESGTHAELLAKPASKYAGQALHEHSRLSVVDPELFFPAQGPTSMQVRLSMTSVGLSVVDPQLFFPGLTFHIILNPASDSVLRQGLVKITY
jgi:hypothetical protein